MLYSTPRVLTVTLAEMRASVSVVVAVLTWASFCTAYQPYQYPGLYHHTAQQRTNDEAALNYQKQILQWQQAVAQRTGQSVYTGPWQGRQDSLPPQPTIVAPLPPAPGQPEAPPTIPPPAVIPEVDNQLVDTTTNTPLRDPLHTLCKAPRGQFPGTSCGKFVNCWDDVVVEQDCPLGLYFNEASGFCDYPFNVACTEQPGQQPGGVQGPVGVGGSPGGQSPETGDLGTPGSKCPTEYGTYRSNKNCGVFYMCVGYVPFEFTCPAGLNFHKDLQVCDYPYRVECDGVPSNQPPPEPTGEPEGQTTYPPPPAPPAEPSYQPDVSAPAPTPVEAFPSQPVVVSPEPTPAVAPLPASTTPDAYYGLKKIPSDLVDSNTPCRPGTVLRLNPSCSSVAVCRNGYTQVLNCGPGTSFDIYSDRCVAFLRARC